MSADPFDTSSPRRLALSLLAAVALLFALAMGALFHAIQTGQTAWALTLWWVIATGLPSGLWICWRVLVSAYRHTPLQSGDILQPIGTALMAAMIGATTASFVY